ncbi:ABC transporter substrate-binding protein [Marinicrinis lubricantis]|uniref:ABC transporter substrate-binding protein n=1 Tax=Marinicrinis lubricantis TaxID=2086470 RepID=A0ABW1IV42_9BACL
MALALMALCIALIAAAGCSSESGNPQSAGSDVTRDELILAVGTEPEMGFDPTTGWGRYGSPLFQSTLLKRDDDLNVVNDLAETYEVSSDGKVWTVELRQGVQFSDGEPLTAEDVQFTFETAASSGSVLDLQNLQQVEAVDNDTVRFTLKQAQSTFLDVLITTGIVPKHAYGEDYAERPIGSGPYRLLQWDQGQQLIVEANPLYYGEKPFFQRLTFLFMNEDAAFAAAKAGDVDIAYIPAAFSRQQVSGMRLENVHSVDNRGIMFPVVPAGGENEQGEPVGNDVTADLAIRQAINIAVDRQALVDGVLEGYGTPAFTVNDGLPWWNPDSIIEDGDPEAAAALLEAAGWTDADGDGVREKNGLKAEFTLLYPAGDLTRQSLAIAAADMMVPIGIQIQVEGKSWDELRKQMHANAVMFGWGSHDPLEMYNLYHSEKIGIELFNPGYYKNDKVDAYLDAAMKAVNAEQAMQHWKNAQWDGETGLSARGDAPWAWLVNIDHLYVVNEKLDIGKQRIHPHGHGWPVTDNVVDWKWNE